MKKAVFILLSLSFLFSCNKAKQQDRVAVQNQEKEHGHPGKRNKL